MSRAKSEQGHSCRKAALCVLLSIMLLSGCSSNGGEGEQSSSPAESVPEAAGASYETCVAELGDSVKTVSISGSLVFPKREELYFSGQGARVDTIMVQNGQEVKAGDVLATFTVESSEADIKEKRLSVEQARRSYTQEVKDREEAIRLQKKAAASGGKAETLKLEEMEASLSLYKLQEQASIQQMEEELGTDREAALADMRYSYIESLVAQCVSRHHETREQQRSEKLDRWLTHKYLGIPIFLCIMLLIFYLTFVPIGGTLQGLLESGIDMFVSWLDVQMEAWQVSSWLHSLVIDGICAGVGSVLSFLPLIVVLFFFLSLLEDSGYMARVAYIMDKALRKIGLSGKSFVPMLIGFGCSVPAIMSTRTLSSERDRKMTIILTPFMSCSAKLPIYGMITAAFFPQHAAVVMLGVYLIGILVAILCGLLFKQTLFKGNPVPFVMELPAYRIPDARSVLMHMWEKAKDFLHRAFTIIFAATIIIWFLQSYGFSFHAVSNASASMLAVIGEKIAWIFEPLGFADWRASSALITGITAKESVVSTLSILTGASTDAGLSSVLQTMFTPLSAFAFLCFTVLYMPCVAAFAATKRELGTLKEALFAVLFQTGVAYIVALIIYQAGSVFL